MPPLVTVIIPTYNRGQMLAAALESVKAQTFGDFEVLVVDDGSEEDLGPVIAAYEGPIRHLRVEHGGAARARNAGIQAAASHLLAFLDSDDLWMAEHLARTVPILLERPEVGLVYHDAVTLDAEGHIVAPRRVRPHPEGRVTDALFAYDFIPTPSVVCRRELVLRAGCFDPAMVPSEDYDLWLKMSLLCGFACAGEPLMQRRQHGGNISRQHRARNEVVRAVLKERFWRESGANQSLGQRFARQVLAKSFCRAGRHLLKAGWTTSARQLLWHAMRHRPLYPPALFWLVGAALSGRTNAAADPAVEVMQTAHYHPDASRPRTSSLRV
jgi:glycosyltransferase involved in cell wall biosynthesis